MRLLETKMNLAHLRELDSSTLACCQAGGRTWTHAPFTHLGSRKIRIYGRGNREPVATAETTSNAARDFYLRCSIVLGRGCAGAFFLGARLDCSFPLGGIDRSCV